MSPATRSRYVTCLVLASVICMTVLACPAAAQMPRIFLRVGDTLADPGEQDVRLPVVLDNYQDSVVAFQIWVQLDRPDIAVFSTDTATVVDTMYWECRQYSGTVCIDSVLTTPVGDWDFFHVETVLVLAGGFDTTGSMCSGWEFIDGRALTGFPYDVMISGVADMPDTVETPGIPPQQGGVLIYLLFDVFDVPDTLTDRTVNVLISYYCLVSPSGQCIGESDSTAVIIDNGSLTIRPPEPICGDVNGDRFGPNIADLTHLVAYLFQSGPAPPVIEAADVNGVAGIDVSDLTYLVDFLFQGGPELSCW